MDLNESTSSTRKPNNIPVSNDNALNVNLSYIPSDNMHNKINSAANVTTHLKDVRQSYREKLKPSKIHLM